MRLRAQHAAELVPQVTRALQAHSALEWEVIFGERVPCAVAHPIEDMFDHPQVLAEQMVGTYTHPKVGSYRGLARAIRFGQGEQAPARAAPSFGEDTQRVLQSLGYSPADIEALRSTGAAR